MASSEAPENAVKKYYLPSDSKQSRIISFSKTPLALFHEKKDNEEAEMYFDQMYLAFPYDYESHEDVSEEETGNFDNFISYSNPDVVPQHFDISNSRYTDEKKQANVQANRDPWYGNDFFKDAEAEPKFVAEGIGFSEVCGLSEAKRTLRNVFISPLLFPHLFPGNIHWNRVLLYGPPGTGKSILAKGIAKEVNCVLHKISSADLLSHWQGETEKQIRSLFQQVRMSDEPAIIFFDEIDGLCRKRTSTEDDLVRRIKTELLIQFEEEPADMNNKNETYIIGATNCPWDIDSAFLRRFHRKIYIPLPDKVSRIEILKKGFERTEISFTDQEWEEIGKITDGYSGSDLINVVMAACCERLHQMMNCKHWIATGNVWVPASPNSLFSTRLNFEDIPPQQMGSRSINFKDLEAAVANTSRTVSSEELDRFAQFSTQHRA